MGISLHLMLNHFPIVGMFLVMVILLYIVMLQNTNNEMKRFGLGLFFAICLTAIPAVITGNMAANDAIKDLALEAFIERHHTLADIAFILSMLSALMSAFFLIKYRAPKLIPNRVMLVILIGSFVISLFMGMVGNLGGFIKHEEIRETKAFNPFKGRIFSREAKPKEKKEK